MKIKKINFLLLGLVLTLIPATSFKNVQAKNININTSNLNQNINDTQTDINDVINEIQQKYLYQKADGTFYIKDEASKEFDTDTIRFIKASMANVNKEVQKGTLEFEIQQNGNEKKVINTKDNFNLEEESNIEPVMVTYNKNSFIFKEEYCEKIDWYWYGCDAYLNKKGAEYLLEEIKHVYGIYEKGYDTTKELTGYELPKTVSSLLKSITYDHYVHELEIGLNKTEKGVIANCLGGSSRGLIYNVEAIY